MKNKKKKEKVELFDRVEITGADYARELYEKESKRFKFRLICTIAAAVGTLLFGLFLGPLNSLTDIVFIDTAVSAIYIAGIALTILSGPVNILKLFLKVGKFFYMIVPFFLFDLIGFVVGISFAFVVFCSLPVVFAGYNLYQSYITKKDAQCYLALSDN